MSINSKSGIGFESLDPKYGSGRSSGVKTQPKRIPGFDQGVSRTFVRAQVCWVTWTHQWWRPSVSLATSSMVSRVLGDLGVPVVAPKCQSTRVLRVRWFLELGDLGATTSVNLLGDYEFNGF